MLQQFPIAFILIGSGLSLSLIGLSHCLPSVAYWDERVFQRLHGRLRDQASFFSFIWPLGTTPVAIVLIAMLFIADTNIGLIASLAYAVAALLERSVKLWIRRPRPFKQLPDVQMGQPKEPHDPSHPSGDALRVWFLALVIPAAFGLSGFVTLLTCALAGILSLGRIALGVHYPLDIIGGAGFGFVTAGFSIINF